jgi:hypothetical protein
VGCGEDDVAEGFFADEFFEKEKVLGGALVLLIL